ncbi:MAG TPA: ABC transporter permease [Candidatus Acetothermia bacterium]|nr:ABC transporter permease [Candidatus Acetothermia bacterium]
MRGLSSLIASELKITLRDRMGLFFTLIFPLIFILIFGFLMGGFGGADSAALGTALLSERDIGSLQEALKDAGAIEVVPFATEEELSDALSKRKVDFGLLWDGEELRFLYDPARVEGNYAFQQLARGISAEFNLLRQGAVPPIGIREIDAGGIETKGWFNLVVPGIIAFSILSAGLFAVSGHITAMKERRILDRLIVTPMRPVSLLVAVAAVRLAIVYFSTLITLGVSILIFGLAFRVDWTGYLLFVGSATIGTMGLGTIIALLVRRPASASNLANVLAMIMLFLSGIYFPIEVMPPFLRALSQGLPLTHMADAMRYVTGVTEMEPVRFWAITLSLLGIGIVLFPILSRYVVRPSRS